MLSKIVYASWKQNASTVIISVFIKTKYNFSYEVYATTVEFKSDIDEMAKYSEFKY